MKKFLIVWSSLFTYFRDFLNIYVFDWYVSSINEGIGLLKALASSILTLNQWLTLNDINIMKVKLSMGQIVSRIILEEDKGKGKE